MRPERLEEHALVGADDKVAIHAVAHREVASQGAVSDTALDERNEATPGVSG